MLVARGPRQRPNASPFIGFWRCDSHPFENFCNTHRRHRYFSGRSFAPPYGCLSARNHPNDDRILYRWSAIASGGACALALKTIGRFSHYYLHTGRHGWVFCLFRRRTRASFSICSLAAPPATQAWSSTTGQAVATDTPTVVDRLRPSDEDIVKAFRWATEGPVVAQDAVF